MSTGNLIELRPQGQLLDSHFDGYKLTLDPLATYRTTLEPNLDICQLNDDQYSMQHLRAFGIHNHLMQDPWNPDLVYFVDESWKVWHVAIGEKKNFKPVMVFQIPHADSPTNAMNRVNVTMQFASKEFAVLSDGVDRLFLLNTPYRNGLEDGGKWKIDHVEKMPAPTCNFSVCSSVLNTNGSCPTLHCLLVHVGKRDEDDRDKMSFMTMIDWFSFTNNLDTWSLQRRRTLESFAAPDYIALEPDGESVLFAAEKSAKMTYDSLRPIENEFVVVEGPISGENKDASFSYTWLQSEQDVSLQFKLPERVGKEDLAVDLSATDIQVGLKDGTLFLSGTLFGKIDATASTWLISEQNLTLELSKQEEGTWSTVVVGDDKGKQVITADQEAKLQDQLQQMTSPSMVDREEVSKPAYNSQQLEDCDAYREESSVMQRFNGESHQVTHQVDLGSHQWLFNCHAESGKAPSICLRHDVDGIVWQPVISEVPWDHVATFNALGYVQAAKTNKKYGGCAPNYSFALLCDCVKHIYIYKQPSAVAANINCRNRKTGQQIKSVAKQYLVSLDSVDNIMGVAITNNRVAVLAGNTLHVITVT